MSPWQPCHPACDETPGTKGLFYGVCSYLDCFLVLGYFTFPASDEATLIILRRRLKEPSPVPPHVTNLVQDLRLRIPQSSQLFFNGRGYGKFYVSPKGYVTYILYTQPNTGRQVPGIVVTNLFCDIFVRRMNKGYELLNCVAVYFDRYVPTFRRKPLALSSG